MSPPPRSIALRPLTAQDARAIFDWPPYPPVYQPLEYALRRGGWLDQFPESTTTHRFGVWRDNALVGFSLLTHIDGRRAEFYIAVHPDQLGQRIGERATRATLLAGFESLALEAIYLKVRSWHRHGQHVYEKAGFIATGEKREEIQGRLETFVLMEITRDRWRAHAANEV